LVLAGTTHACHQHLRAASNAALGAVAALVHIAAAAAAAMLVSAFAVPHLPRLHLLLQQQDLQQQLLLQAALLECRHSSARC
jgi:hypothetical protein